MLAITGALAGPSSGRAQDGEHLSGIVGTVVEAGSGHPVTGAALSLNGTGWTRTSGADGAFAFEELPPGTYELVAGHLAYGDVAAFITVPARRSVRVEVRVSVEPIVVEPIVVVAVRDGRLERNGFYERREWGEARGVGRYLAPEEIAGRPLSRLSRLVASLSGVDARRVCGSFGCFELLFARARPPVRTGSLQFPAGSRRGETSPGVEHCPMRVFLDGTDARLFRFEADGIEVFRGVDEVAIAAEVIAIEVYERASGLPGEFSGSDSQCGVVAVWTR